MQNILALDTYYLSETLAKTVGVLFHEWSDSTPSAVISVYSHSNFGPYIPGEFYKRELPCLLDFFKVYTEYPSLDYIILDSFLRLKENDGIEKPGLGIKLKETLKDLPKLIGVAKTNYCRSNEIADSVLRGISKNPLYVQGISGDTIKNMHGENRLPTLLKLLDIETKRTYEKVV